MSNQNTREYIFCPNCGKKDLEKSEEKIICLDCKFVKYNDPSPGASALPVKDGKVLLAVRKDDPFKGTYDVIGGFVKPGESAEEAAVRETKEETGLNVKVIKLLASYPDVYGEGGDPILVLQFVVEIVDGEMKASDDVSELEWVDIDDLPKLKNIGFESVKKTLTELYTQKGEFM